MSSNQTLPPLSSLTLWAILRLLRRAGGTMDEADVAVVRELFAAFDEGELDRAVATVTEDFELVDIAADQTFQGPAGLRQWLETFRTALPDARTELVNAFGADG